MHILMLSDVFFPRVNGVSTSIQTFAQSFLSLGHRVTLIAPDYPGAYESELDVIRIPSTRLPFDPEDRLMQRRAIKRLVPQLRDGGYDIIHIQTPFVAHYAGVYLGKVLDLKVVTSYHTFFEAYFEKYLPWIPSRWLRAFARRYSRKQCDEVDGVISPSRQMLEKLREYGTNTPARVIGTGLELHRFQYHGENDFRAKHQIDSDTPLLLYVGRVAFEKNIEFLFEMFGHVHRRLPTAKLLVAGEGPALPSLQRRTTKMGLREHIVFVGYLERRVELVACYHASDLFVFASETETQGLVLLEAMACGLPVVSTASMGTRDVLHEGKGCLIAPPVARAFADRALSLLLDSNKSSALSTQGIEYAATWSTEAKAFEMIDFYQQVLTPAKTGQPAGGTAPQYEAAEN